MNIRKKISAIIFDCDGVMFDSYQANIKYYNHILARFNLPPMREDDFDYVHMHPADKSVRHIFRGTPYEEKAQAYRLQTDYTPFIKDMIIEPGLKELLRLLKPHFGLAVATNRSHTIGDVIKRHGIKDLFDIVVSSVDVKEPKPDPETIFKVLDFFGIGPEQALYVGDSQVDYETASAAGVPLIAYRNKALNADRHIENLMEINEMLLAPSA